SRLHLSRVPSAPEEHRDVKAEGEGGFEERDGEEDVGEIGGEVLEEAFEGYDLDDPRSEAVEEGGTPWGVKWGGEGG
ncbi:hypothetical protein HK104_007665, partial [Borealophlyctis nickersoniae]